jgi:hypothetical protein
VDPTSRSAVLAAAIFFCVIFLFMTLAVAAQSSFDIFTLAAVIIIAMIAAGLFGAMRNPPDD